MSKESKTNLLEAYRRIKSHNRDTLSRKMMRIAQAGKDISETQAVCIFCDADDACIGCDAIDFDPVCATTDHCPLGYDIT
jgi:hypothetical protein